MQFTLWLDLSSLTHPLTLNLQYYGDRSISERRKSNRYFFEKKGCPAYFQLKPAFQSFSILATFLLFEIVCQQRNLAATLIFNFRKFHFNFQKLKLSAPGKRFEYVRKMKLSAGQFHCQVDLDFQFQTFQFNLRKSKLLAAKIVKWV